MRGDECLRAEMIRSRPKFAPMVTWAQRYHAQIGSRVRHVVHLNSPRAADEARQLRNAGHMCQPGGSIIACEVCRALLTHARQWLTTLLRLGLFLAYGAALASDTHRASHSNISRFQCPSASTWVPSPALRRYSISKSFICAKAFRAPVLVRNLSLENPADSDLPKSCDAMKPALTATCHLSRNASSSGVHLRITASPARRDTCPGSPRARPHHPASCGAA